jgi:taurine dioxygenase
MGELRVRRLGYALGAEVTGVDLSRRLDEATVAEIRRLMLDHVVLCFPQQNLEAEALKAFCSRFGELENNEQSINRHPDDAEVLIVANKPLVVNGKQFTGYARADKWHSDHSFTSHPTTLTFLVAKELPEIGGNTMWANMYMAYDALSRAMQRLIEPLSAMHDIKQGPAFARVDATMQAKLTQYQEPVAHPVVSVHPETGRKVLYVGTRLRKFVGMSEEESKPLIDFLNQHAVRYEFLYRHRWSLSDLVVWDNRCALHFAVQDYDQGFTRRMLRCSLVGPQSGELHPEETGAALAAPALAG